MTFCEIESEDKKGGKWSSSSTTDMDPFPPPTGGASLVLSFRMHTKYVLIVGGDALAASRAYASLEADAVVKVLVNGGFEAVCEELRWRAEHGQLEVIDWDHLPVPGPSVGSLDMDTSKMSREMAALDHYFADTPVSLVCVTDTTSTSPFAPIACFRAIHLARLCRARRIPINVTDMPEFCDFSFTATHRFVDPVSSSKTPLQIGVTTNGEGCRLGGRVRREIVAGLSKDAGVAVTKVGQLRKMAGKLAKENGAPADGDGGEDCTVTTPNRPVPIRAPGGTALEESSIEAAKRQMRWVVQVSEYWPISRLAAMTEREMKKILDGEVAHEGTTLALSADEKKSQHGVDVARPLPKHNKGRILLAGSGPGHPSLLTLATHTALTRHADIVLSDKLVPAPVLELIPPHIEVRIARKFPGNADGAQTEMMEAAVEAANRGLTVVRVRAVLAATFLWSRVLICPFLCCSPFDALYTYNPAETRRSDSVRPRRRGTCLLSCTQLRSTRPSRALLRARCTRMRRDPSNAPWRCRVLCCLHRRRTPRQDGLSPRLRPRTHRTRAHGRRAAQRGRTRTRGDRTRGTTGWPCLPSVYPDRDHRARLDARSEGTRVDARGCGECARGCRGAATAGDDRDWVGCVGIWAQERGGWGCWGGGTRGRRG